jgi:hypothetical protein
MRALLRRRGARHEAQGKKRLDVWPRQSLDKLAKLSLGLIPCGLCVCVCSSIHMVLY